MTVNKLSLPSKENAVQEKVNEIIDAIPTDTSDLTNGAGFIDSSDLANYVTTNTQQTISAAKFIVGLDSGPAGSNQANVFTALSTQNSNSSNTGWVGRSTFGAKNLTFLMGTYKGMAGIGAHSWTDSYAGTGAAWADVYFNPDGAKTVYIGGYAWKSGSGWFRVQNSGSNTGGKTQVNIGSVNAATWKDVAYKGENVSDFNNDAGYTTNVGTVTSVNNISPTNGNVSLSIPTDTNDLTNGAGYTTNVGTVTSVNNTSPDGSGNVTINIPTVENSTITITQGGVYKGEFTLNQSVDGTIDLDAGGGGTATDVQINGTSITSSNVANIITNTAYNASSNKIATMSDVPSISGLANADLSNLSSTGEAKFVKGTKQQIYPVVATYRSGSSWYRIYADGWCEQGGVTTAPNVNAFQVTLHKKMADTNYTLLVTQSVDNSTSGDWFATYLNKTVSNFQVRVRPYDFTWYVAGHLASGQYTSYTIYGIK